MHMSDGGGSKLLAGALEPPDSGGAWQVARAKNLVRGSGRGLTGVGTMAPTMRASSTTEMVERKVLEMAQHASFHQHVSYNLSTILHAFTAGKTDPTEIAEAFSRARGLEVITRVISGDPLAKPPVVSLCCQVGRQVVDKFGPGVSQSQAGGLVEALVARLALGMGTGDDAQTVECQVECARLMSSVAGQAASLLIDGGALESVEGMLDQLGGKHSSILRPCCEALERVSRAEEGRAAFEERGTGGVLLATIRDFPEALEEGSDAALASAMKVVERIFTDKSPEGCALSLRAKADEQPGGDDGDDNNPPTPNDYANCVETLLKVVEATPEAPGAAAATCLWWLSGASSRAPDRALSGILSAAEAVVGKEEEEEAAALSPTDDVWSWLPRGGGGEAEEVEEGEVVPQARPIEAARFLAALCLCKPGIGCLEEALKRESPLQQAVDALVTLCGSADPLLARACLRIVERLAGSLGPRALVDAGALAAAVEAGKRFEVDEGAETVEDAEARAVAAALGTVAALAEAGGKEARPLVDDAFQLSVRCLGRVGEFSGRPAAAAAKSALDVITVRLTRPDRSPAATAAASGVDGGSFASEDGEGGGEGEDGDGADAEEAAEGGVGSGDGDGNGDGEADVDAPMEVLKDAGAILAVMKAHSTDARVQQSGWRSLIAMDTGRGDVDKFWTGAGDGQQSRRQMLRDCLERHGGDSLVAGQVADILEGLVLQGDSDGDGSSLTASLSDAHGEDSPLPNTYNEEAEEGDAQQADVDVTNDGDANQLGGGDGEEEAAGADGGADTGGDEDDDESAVTGDGEPSLLEGGLEPEEVLVELSREGTKALEGGSDSSSSGGDATAAAAGATSRDASTVTGDAKEETVPASPSVARSLFGFSGKGGGRGKGARARGGKGAKVEEGAEDEGPSDAPVVPSKEEIKLQSSWAKLEALHSDIVGRSQILGGESAQMVAAMPEPRVLKTRVGVLLEEAEGGDARDAFAAASLALVGALTSATGALANSQKEVQRYLAMSRDLRETSTWKDLSEAMQWTMDSLKGTVILFTPHTGNGLTKALGLCKNMESAFKLFKEAALQIKIIVVELAGEHEPNTVWRVNPDAFESLPENRKVMMLKHLRNLVVAYDHLSDDMRRDLTTALEIIKNREVLNMMGKYCIQSEAAEEKRREAKLASAEERLKVGTRRSSATRTNAASGRRSPPPPGNASTPSRSGGAAADSPSSAGSNAGGSRASPPPFGSGTTSRRVPLSTPRSTRSTDSSSTPAGGGTSASRKPRGVASQSRGRRDTTAAAAAAAGSPANGHQRRSKSPVTRGRNITPATAAAAGSLASGHNRRSKSPVTRGSGGRSKSPTARRPAGRSKSPVTSKGGRRLSRSPVTRSKKSG
eukprot:g7033.t1